MKEPLSVELREGCGAKLQMCKGSTFRALISVNSCLKGYKKMVAGEKLEKENITLGEMRLCSFHIIFMAAEQE